MEVQINEVRTNEGQVYMCFADIEKAFDRVPQKLIEKAMRTKDLPEVNVRTVMSLYRGAKAKVRVGSKLSEELLVPAGVH